MNISEHITYREATRSQTAINKGIDNIPNIEQLKAMKLIAEMVFEPLRRKFDKSIKIESFFRSKGLNKAIGGSQNSQHMKGEAIDLDDDYGGLTNANIFYHIADNLEFDQLIWEFGDNCNPGWVHVSYNYNNRNRITLAYKSKGKTIYQHFTQLSDFIIFKENVYKPVK